MYFQNIRVTEKPKMIIFTSLQLVAHINLVLKILDCIM